MRGSAAKFRVPIGIGLLLIGVVAARFCWPTVPKDEFERLRTREDLAVLAARLIPVGSTTEEAQQTLAARRFDCEEPRQSDGQLPFPPGSLPPAPTVVPAGASLIYCYRFDPPRGLLGYAPVWRIGVVTVDDKVAEVLTTLEVAGL